MRKQESKAGRSREGQAWTLTGGVCGGLGRYRWMVERTLSWLNRFRRLKLRYEHRADIHLPFLHLGCTLIFLRFLG